MMINRAVEWVFEYFQSAKWAWYGVGAAYRNQIRWEAGETDRRSLVSLWQKSPRPKSICELFKIGGKIEDSGFGRYLEIWLDKKFLKGWLSINCGKVERKSIFARLKEARKWWEGKDDRLFDQRCFSCFFSSFEITHCTNKYFTSTIYPALLVCVFFNRKC